MSVSWSRYRTFTVSLPFTSTTEKVHGPRYTRDVCKEIKCKISILRRTNEVESLRFSLKTLSIDEMFSSVYVVINISSRTKDLDRRRFQVREKWWATASLSTLNST